MPYLHKNSYGRKCIINIINGTFYKVHSYLYLMTCDQMCYPQTLELGFCGIF